MTLKGLSHEIKRGCRRYGCLDLCVKMPQKVKFTVNLLFKYKSSKQYCKMLVDFQLTSGDSLQTQPFRESLYYLVGIFQDDIH
jgi:hypothetical protein